MAQMTMAEMQAMLTKLQADNEKLRAEKALAGKISLKVSEKGAVSAYGLGRFPITLYREQWERLLAHKEQIETFIGANAKLLSTKDTVKAAAPAGAPAGDDVPVAV